MQFSDFDCCGPAHAIFGTTYTLQDGVPVDSQAARCSRETPLCVENSQQCGALPALPDFIRREIAELSGNESPRRIQITRDGIHQSNIAELGDRRRCAPGYFDDSASAYSLEVGGAKAGSPRVG